MASSSAREFKTCELSFHIRAALLSAKVFSRDDQFEVVLVEKINGQIQRQVYRGMLPSGVQDVFLLPLKGLPLALKKQRTALFKADKLLEPLKADLQIRQHAPTTKQSTAIVRQEAANLAKIAIHEKQLQDLYEEICGHSTRITDAWNPAHQVDFDTAKWSLHDKVKNEDSVTETALQDEWRVEVVLFLHSELTRLVLVKGDCSVSGAEIWSSDISTPANLTMGSTSSHRDTESFMYTAKASRAQTESDTLQWKLHPDTPPFTPLATEHVQRTSVDILYRVKKEKCASPDPFAWEPAGQIPAIGGDFTTMLSDAVSTRPDEVWNTSVVSTLAPESQVLMHGSSNYELEMDPSWSVMHANVSKTFSPGHDFDRWPRQTLNITPEQHKVLPSGWQQTSCSASLGQRLPVQAERHRQFFEQHLPRSDYQYPRTTLPSVSQLLNGITISPSTHSNMTTRAARSGIDNETLSYLTYQDAQANTFARNTVQGLEYSAREMNNYSSYTTPTRTPDYPTALPATVAAKPATTTSSYHSRSSLQSNTPGRAKAKTVTKRHAQTSETAARKRPRAA